MDPVRRAIERAGGVLRRRDLLELGLTDHQIVAALRDRTIVRARQGWFAVPGLPEITMLALRVGGLVTGMAALESYGVWVPRRERPVVQVARNAARFSQRVPAGRVRVQWGGVPPTPLGEGSFWRVSPGAALAHVLEHCDRDTAVVLADSMLNQRSITPQELEAVFREAGPRVEAWLDLVDGRADAGGETYARLWLGDVGIRAEPQFVVPGAGPFDLRVSRRGLLEVDGRAHHDDAESFHRDREKDLRAAEWGFTPLRITYAQLQRDWPACLAVVRRFIREHG